MQVSLGSVKMSACVRDRRAWPSMAQGNYEHVHYKFNQHQPAGGRGAQERIRTSQRLTMEVGGVEVCGEEWVLPKFGCEWVGVG